MWITSDVESTSASALSRDRLLPLLTAATPYAGASDILPVLVASRRDVGYLTDEAAAALSGTRGSYSAQVTINSPSATSFITAGAGKIRFTCFGHGSLTPLFFESVRHRLTSNEGGLTRTPFKAWTIRAAMTVHTDVHRALDSLRGVVASIHRTSPLQLSAELELMLDQAAHAHGTPEDVTAWARRLAEDVRDLAD